MSLIGQQEEAFRKGRVKETELQRPLFFPHVNPGPGEYRAEDPKLSPVFDSD
jgi:hypothetical protein